MNNSTYTQMRSDFTGRFGVWFNQSNAVFQTLTVSAFAICVQRILLPLGKILNAGLGSHPNPPLQNAPLAVFLLSAFVLAPLIETLLFQLAVFALCRKFGLLQKKGLMVVCISAFLFSVQHIDSAGHMLWTLGVGFVFGCGFLMSRSFTGGFWVVCFSHMFMNMLSYFISRV